MTQKVLPFLCVAMFLTIDASADTGYINDVARVILRSGPSTEHRIITTLESGQALEIIETNEDWARIKLAGDREGWVLARFISQEPPANVLLEKLRGDHEDLMARMETMRGENHKLTSENTRLKQELETIQLRFEEVSAAYDSLKQESAEFLSLKERHSAASDKLETLEKEFVRLEKALESRYTEVLLAGGGILLVGLIVGLLLGGRRRKSGSSLYR